MKILFCGGGGFIGSHLAEKFLMESYDVVVIDNLSTGNIQNLKSCFLHSNFRFVKGDILDRFTMESLISECDAIFHFAALVGMKLATRSFWDIYQNNIEGTRNVIELANKYGKKVFLASTSEIYGKLADSNTFSLSENLDIKLGNVSNKRWAYAYSKLLDELLAFSYIEKYNLPIVIFRFFNVIGPKQASSYGMVCPFFVENALKNEPIIIYGDGTQTRSFVDIDDVVDDLYKLFFAEKAIGEAINIGNEKAISINDLALDIKNLTKSKSEIIHKPYEEIFGKNFEDVQYRKPNLTKIKGLIDFKPRIELENTIKKIIEYKNEKENNIYI